MSKEQRIKELINNLKAAEAPGYDDPRDARINAGKFHQDARKELISIGAPAVPFLIEESKEPKMRDLIKEIGDGAIEPLLVHLQENQNSPYLEYVIGTLGLLKAESTSDLLLNYLKTSDNLDARLAAARSLGLIHKERGKIEVTPMFELLDTLLNDAKTDSNGRYEFPIFRDGTRCEDVVGGIGSAGDGRATDRLVGLLGKTKGILKLRVAQALGAIGDERAVTPLIENINSNEEFSDLMTKELVKFKDLRGREFAQKFVQENPTLQYVKQIKDELARIPTPVSTRENPVAPKLEQASEQPFTQKAPENNKRSKILIAIGVGVAVLCVCCIVASLAVTYWRGN